MLERAAHLVNLFSGNTVFLETIFPLAHDARQPLSQVSPKRAAQPMALAMVANGSSMPSILAWFQPAP